MSIYRFLMGGGGGKREKKATSRRLRFESLETRELLSVDFAAIQSQYKDLILLEKMSDYNVIEITADELTDAKLRDAIAQAAGTTKDDLIVVRTTNSQNTITLSGTELLIDIDDEQWGSVTLVSYGAKSLTIDAAENSRVLYVTAGTKAALGGVAAIKGNSIISENAGKTYGGGIYNAGTLSLSYCAVSGNLTTSFSATSPPGIPYAYGGGIYNSGTMDISHSEILDNIATAWTTQTWSPYAYGGGIYNSGTMTIKDSLISNNRANAYNLNITGGIASGGGIYSTSTLTVSNTTIRDNVSYGDTQGHGGGIYATRSLTLSDSVVKNNAATSAGTSTDGNAGGIYAGSYSSIARTVINDNSARGNGGGIQIVGATISDCIISHNLAGRSGGGIYAMGGMIRSCSIIDNFAMSVVSNASGGGIYALLSSSGGGGPSLYLYNSTIADNTVMNSDSPYNSYTGRGGGIYCSGDYATLFGIYNCTIVNNAAREGGGVYGSGYSPPLNFYNTIISDNESTVYYAQRTLGGANNYINDDMGMNFYTNGVNGNIVSTEDDPIDLKAGKLTQAENGHWYLPLIKGSPAIDGGNNSNVPSNISRDITGSERIVGDKVDIGSFEYILPGVPQVTATLQTNGNVQLSWKAIAGADSYQVWRKENGKWVNISGKVIYTNFTDSNVPAGASQSYAVRAYKGNVYGDFKEVSVAMIGTPQVTATLQTNGNVRLSWQPIAGADSYQVWRKENGKWVNISGKVIDTNFTDSNVPAGASQSYAVRAYTGSTYGDFKEVSVATLGVPQVTATLQTNGNVQLSWKPIAGADSYQVWRKENGKWVNISGKIIDTNFIDQNVPAGASQSYAVRAYIGNAYGNFKEVSVATLGVPQVTATLQTNGNVRLSWQPIAGADSYQVWRKENGKWVNISGKITDANFIDQNVPAGASQSYAVRAYIGSTYGDFKEVSVATLGVPQVTAMLQTNGNVRLSWQPIAGADSYQVWRKENGKWVNISGKITDANFIDQNVPAGASQSYAVRAYIGSTYGNFKEVSVITASNSFSPNLYAAALSDFELFEL